MPSYATVEDVANILGGTVDDARTQALLDMGTELINAYLGVDGNIDPAPIECRVVNANQATRTLSNPQGVKSEQLASYSTTYADVSAGLTLTDADREMLDGIPGMTMIRTGAYDVATPQLDALGCDEYWEPGLWHVRAAARRLTPARALPRGRVARR